MRRVLRRLIESAVLHGQDPSRLATNRDRFLNLAVLLEDKVRRLTTPKEGLPEIVSCDRQSTLKVAICDRQPPWAAIPLEALNVPGMITKEERRYYTYLGSFYSGQGEVVELGSWLGLSTLAILYGLRRNPAFAGKKLHVFDDFVWRSSWMDKWLDDGDFDIEKPHDHGDFSGLFDRFTSGVREHMVVERRRIAPYDGNERIAPLTWNGRPIEMVFVDCGRTLEVNEAWYKTLSPSFIPGRSLLVLEDWKTHREVPPRWYNQTKQFTDSKGRQLRLLHELRDGGAATFLYQAGAQ